MKILWFAHRDIKNPKAGGAERTIYEVGTRLSKLNIEIHLVTVNPGNLLEYENVDGIITHRIKGNIKTHLSVRKIKEIPYKFVERERGKSKVPSFPSITTIISYGRLNDSITGI